MRASDDKDDGCDGGQTDEYVTLPPPLGWRVPRRNRNTGEGGRVPWRLMQGRDTGEASRAGSSGFRRPWWIGSFGWPWQSVELGWP